MAAEKRRKKFFEVEIPLINKETELQAFEKQELEGRYIKYDLSRILRGKSIILQLIVNVKDNSATTIPKQIILLSSYIKKIIRKGTNYIEDSFSANAKDAVLTIKPFLITRRKVSRAIRKALRNKAREDLTEYVKTMSYEEVFRESLKNTLQKTLSLRLKKIYPLSACEIRILKVEKYIDNPEIKKEKTASKKIDIEKEIENIETTTDLE